MTPPTRPGVLPRRPVEAECRLCLQHGKLSYEHIPPRAAGNRNGERWERFDLDTWLEHGSPFEPPQHGIKIEQKGAGGHVYCRECNSLLGSKYVREYVEWATKLGQALLEHPSSRQMWLQLKLDDVRPGAFARQVAAMLLPMCGEGHARKDPALADAIRGESRVPTTRLFVALYRGPLVRHVGVSGTLHKREDGGFQHLVSAEVAFPPFAVTAVLSGEPQNDELGVEITSWLDVPADEPYEVQLTAPVGEGRTPYPGDFRTASEFGDG